MLTENDEAQEGEVVEFIPENSNVEDTEDGGAIIRLENEEQNKRSLEHFENIVEEVDPGLLKEAVNDLLEKIDRDKEAREKRDKLYEEGLRRTGLGPRKARQALRRGPASHWPGR